MSADLDVVEASREAMARGWAEFFLDVGPGYPQLLIYSTPRPAFPGVPVNDVAAVTMELARPSGYLINGYWRLVMRDIAGYQAHHSGTPVWARLLTAGGLWAADGDAGGPNDDVAFKLDKPAFQVGGYVLLLDAGIE